MSKTYQEISNSLKKVESKRGDTRTRKEALTQEIYLDITKLYKEVMASLPLCPDKQVNKELITAEQQLAMENLRNRMCKLKWNNRLREDSNLGEKVTNMIRELGLLSGIELPDNAPILHKGWWDLSSVARERPWYAMVQRAPVMVESAQSSLAPG